MMDYLYSVLHIQVVTINVQVIFRKRYIEKPIL